MHLVLSGEQIKGVTGRHPLPTKAEFEHALRRLGISNQSQVVAYDYQAGQSAAGRLWWMLKWAGHSAAAVIDGGITQWVSHGLPVESVVRHNAPGDFVAAYDDSLLISTDEVARIASDPAYALLDSRAADRFRGENETIDPVAGHIPGAISAPFSPNINATGTLKSAAELSARFAGLAADIPAERTVFYCGSGVSVAQNILAHAHIGRGMPRLYAGSWSEWIASGTRSVATGDT
jgi:thiosulfate/3-mercaptopyruvate sulfurtransferase